MTKKSRMQLAIGEALSKFSRLRLLALGLLLLTLTAFQQSMSGQRAVKPTLVSGIVNISTPDSLIGQLDSINNYIGVDVQARKPLIYAKQFLLLDAESAEVIISQGADNVIPIASTTKMTTALVALSKMPLNQIVTVSNKPPSIEGSKIGLKTGEKITVRNLIQGLLIYSGNDAAFALAENFAREPGDYKKFVQAMNDFAAANHLVNTTYGDPAGLDDGIGRSTARELSSVARLLLKEPFLAETVITPSMSFSSIDGQITHFFKNTNRLIMTDSPYYLSNSMGVKTGFTLAAGHSLVAAYKWQNRVLIGVVMNTIESTNIASAVEMNKLFRWADASLVLKKY